MKNLVSQPPSLPEGYVAARYRLPDCAGPLTTRWRAGSTPSCHPASVPDSKSSANMTALSPLDCTRPHEARSTEALRMRVRTVFRCLVYDGLLLVTIATATTINADLAERAENAN